jgi:hypothetical protein
MDRRGFLRAGAVAVGTLGAGAALAGCGRDTGGIPSGEPSLSVAIGSYETLTGEPRPVNLVVMENDGTAIAGATVAVYVREPDGAVRSGPHEATFYPESGEGTGTGRGIYQTLLPLAEPGDVELVAVEGDRYGTAILRVLAPETSAVPAPGEPAIATATPTVAQDLGVSPLCTEDPPCPLHEVSLDAALGAGRPVLLLFATPRYCQTVACAPAVGNLVRVSAERDWGDLAFVHCEIYPDEASVGQRFVQAVIDWQLPTEPWLFAIGGDGLVSDRLDGPMLEVDVRRLAEGVV